MAAQNNDTRGSNRDVRTAIMQLLAARGPDKTICPSEAARRVRPDAWRPLLPIVREAAGQLAAAGTIVVQQGDRTVDVADARGPIRLALASGKSQQQNSQDEKPDP
ncbi:MAG: S-adenosylmethionine tRNA ribosyltransferase [Planctomycetaceae bacterium]|nr:S-adenosylmethionine tRNA ribosyltransferase [Planctomycetaceae bacterium]